ncbi:hypothetical protein ACS0TY_012692 [Phlomoides rotata]
MAKVHPQVVVSNSTSSKQEVFTLWMKSLIMSSNGCAVFDSNGRIVYRVDNYTNKCINQVYVMDATGKALFTILKKKFSLFGMWEGYRSRDMDTKTRFRFRKLMGIRTILGFFRGYSFYKVVIRMNDKRSCEYIMENQSSKLCCRIVDDVGGLVAEVIMNFAVCLSCFGTFIKQFMDYSYYICFVGMHRLRERQLRVELF